MLRLARAQGSRLPALISYTRTACIMTSAPKVVSVTEMSASEAKWIALHKIQYTDADGKSRLWECASRKTRGSSGIDGSQIPLQSASNDPYDQSNYSAVAVMAIISSKTKAFPLSTVIIEQYRPPIDKFIIELPAGLVDKNEKPEEAAIRELEEETGFKAERVVNMTPLIVSDPGMTDANMMLVTLSVSLDDKLELPKQKLDAGEHIVRRVVELEKLDEELKAYDKKGFVVDARLSHFANGYDLAKKVAAGQFS